MIKGCRDLWKNLIGEKENYFLNYSEDKFFYEKVYDDYLGIYFRYYIGYFTGIILLNLKFLWNKYY